MGFTTDTIKQTLLGFISSQAAVSEKYTTIKKVLLRIIISGLKMQRRSCSTGA